MDDKVFSIVVHYMGQQAKLHNINRDKYSYLDLVSDIRDMHGIQNIDLSLTCSMPGCTLRMHVRNDQDVLNMFDGNQSRDELDVFVVVNQEGGNNEVGGNHNVSGGSHNESGGSDNESGSSEESMYAAATDEESHDTSMSLVVSDTDVYLSGYKSDDHCEAENLFDEEFCSDPMKGALSRDACVVHDGLRSKLMSRLQKRKQKGVSWKGVIVPNVVKLLNTVREESRKCSLLMIGEGEYEVNDANVHYIVNLRKRTCDCKFWEIAGVPCRHAALGIAHRREELETYTDVRFSKQKYMRAYGHCIHPIPDPSFWPEEIDVTPTDLKPRAIKRMPGRPKKSRRKESGEATRAIRRANVLKCKICNGNGYNRITCPNKDVDLNVPISQLVKKRMRGKRSRNETLGMSSSQPLPTNRDEPEPVSASQPLLRACSQAEVAQKRPATKKSKPAAKPAPTASATHTLRPAATSQPLPNELLLPPSLFRLIGVPSNVRLPPNEPKKNDPRDCPQM
ncbi:hypothetical protein Salat_2672700 [Sesamum alatum]|uniref:SWIM-type domain-containing protein n=1 Tax=Sesamum alatum TaxID=300844 RepID=A0AAE2CB30_9LAMI|nr:hypothetical protein Salat_2672700 [Sesamum alatum]